MKLSILLFIVIMFALGLAFAALPSAQPLIACLFIIVLAFFTSLLKKQKTRNRYYLTHSAPAPATALAEIKQEDPELAQKIGFPPEILEIARREGKTTLEQFHSRVDDCRNKAHPGLELAVNQEDSRTVVKNLRTHLEHLGYLVFVCEYGNGNRPDKVGILKEEDQYKILRLLEVDGVNCDIDTDALISKLSFWDKLYGLRIYGADISTVEVDFDQLPEDLQAFSQEVYEFCPDCESPEEVSKELSQKKSLFLWWD